MGEKTWVVTPVFLVAVVSMSSAMASGLRVVSKRAFSTTSVSRSGAGHDATARWKKVTFFVAFPAITLAALNVKFNSSHPEQPEFKPYEHLRIRNKKFPGATATIPYTTTPT